MKIVIVGAGAMGCLYGSYLSRGWENVCLLDSWQDHVVKINTAGLSLVAAGEEFVSNPRAATNASEVPPADLIIICVKSHQTTEAAIQAELFVKPDTTILTLQNGLGNTEILADHFGADRILVGTTLMGAVVLEPGLVFRSGVRETHIASWTNASDPRIAGIAKIFAKCGLPVIIEKNCASLLWSKLSIHAGLNAITALTRTSNRLFLKQPEAIRLSRLVVAEVAAVATAADIPLLYPNCAQAMLAYAEAMKDYQSPMLQDVLHRRKTEIDAINGAVVAEGKRQGVPTPVNEALTLAMKTVEAVY